MKKKNNIAEWSTAVTFVASDGIPRCSQRFPGEHLANFINGKWMKSSLKKEVISPIDGEWMFSQPDTQKEEIGPFVEFLKSCPEGGLHNPFRNTERYALYGSLFAEAANLLSQHSVEEYFSQLIQAVMPKSYEQARGEVTVTRDALYNLAGDGVRFASQWTGVPGDHSGQHAAEHRFPYGPAVIIAPFNFPLEIPALQLVGALAMGNKVLIKGASTVSVVIEQFIRMLLYCGMPKEDVALIHCGGEVMEEIIRHAKPKMTQFTGSSAVAKKLIALTDGKIRVEDSGFNWKILGPDIPKCERTINYVAWQCDQDAYAASGQKCSAQSLLFIHKNWHWPVQTSPFTQRLKTFAAKRSLENLTNGPLLSHSTQEVLEHIDKLISIGGLLLWGGKEIKNHSIPDCYGAVEPTAIKISPSNIVEHFSLVTKEIFGPLQIIAIYDEEDIDLVLDIIWHIPHKLTAAIVSNKQNFVNSLLGVSTNGTTYAGYRARTTGAPQWHGFHPAGALSANIGTREAMRETWSYDRTIVFDTGPVPRDMKLSQT